MRSFSAALKTVQAERRHFDLVVTTDDLTQDPSPQAYRHFTTWIVHLPATLHLVAWRS